MFSQVEELHLFNALKENSYISTTREPYENHPIYTKQEPAAWQAQEMLDLSVPQYIGCDVGDEMEETDDDS